MNLTQLENTTYLQEILSQADALRNALLRFDVDAIEALANRLQAREFDRIVITGLGASLFASYPAYLLLSRHSGVPVVLLDTAELIHYAPEVISPRTLLWGVSQSGRSIEIQRLAELAAERNPDVVMAVTRDASSPLAVAADLPLFLHTEVEKTVSTRTYLNTLALMQLAATALCSQDIQTVYNEINALVDPLQHYLADWKLHLSEIGERIGLPATVTFLGRGASYSSAMSAALIQFEAAKYSAVGMETAEYRHGPLEAVEAGVTVVLFAGSRQTAAFNRGMFDDIRDREGHALWIDPAQSEAGSGLAANFVLPSPYATGAAMPLADILPAQLLTLHLGISRGYEPGKFRHIGKVTLKE